MLQRWDPFRDLRRIEENMDRFARGFRFSNGNASAGWAVPLDVVQDDDNMIVRASMPGMKPEDISVTIEDDVLSVSGETSEEHEEEKENYLMRERKIGKFRRSLRLPDTVDVDKAETTYENGVLTVSFPKVEAKKAKKLTVSIK